MNQLELLSGVGNGVFVLACGAMGIRLLMLARRTSRKPELLIGASLAMIAFLGFPLVAASGLGRATVE